MSDHFKSIRENAVPFDYSEIQDPEHGFLADYVIYSSEDEQFEEKSIVTVQPSLLPESRLDYTDHFFIHANYKIANHLGIGSHIML